MESVGFKEWSLVCEALGCGRQSIILRKGGIAEGRNGFSFRHREFFLFPTWFHEQAEKVREIETESAEPNPDRIDIRFFARVEASHLISSLQVVEGLAPLHILQPAVVRERFEYSEAHGLHVALVRMYGLEPTWIIENEKKYGGCRSWVDLPEPPKEFQLHPILSDEEHQKRDDFLRQLLS
jgi:hypothetical protein